MLGPRDGPRLEILGGYPPEDTLDARDRGAAEWAWDHGEPAGWGSATLPAASWLFLPLKTAQGMQGLLGVKFPKAQPVRPEERRLLEALVDQVAIALERTKLASDMEETRVLSETERLRAALLSSVSHDLRTPLVSIIGAATSLLESDEVLGPGGRRAMAETIRDEGERLNRYVQNLLDMTRLGYGALKVARDVVDLRETVGRAVRQLRSAFQAHRVEFDLPRDLPPVLGDPVLLEQVVANILDNASKYAPSGTAIRVEATAAAGEVVLSIVDEGPGIPPGDRDKVFDMFYRVRAGDGQRAGTGLGLAICKGIVDAHGGRIMVSEGMNGRGTRIAITLPIARDPAADAMED